jgi:hypothetical protein
MLGNCSLLTAANGFPISNSSTVSTVSLVQTTEEVMGHRPFSKPVFLKLHRTGNFQARSPWEALEYLDLHWPSARTAHFRRARALCDAAVSGLVDAEAARQAVVDAAQRSRLLASGWQVDGEARNTAYIVNPTSGPQLPEGALP